MHDWESIKIKTKHFLLCWSNRTSQDNPEYPHIAHTMHTRDRVSTEWVSIYPPFHFWSANYLAIILLNMSTTSCNAYSTVPALGIPSIHIVAPPLQYPRCPPPPEYPHRHSTTSRASDAGVLGTQVDLLVFHSDKVLCLNKRWCVQDEERHGIGAIKWCA